MKLPQFISEDKILKLILSGVLVPLVLVGSDILLNYLGIKLSITGDIFNYLIYAFGVSLFAFVIYIPFFKKTASPKTKEVKALIILWLFVSFIVLIFLAKIYPNLLSTGEGMLPSLSLENIAFLLLILGAVLFAVGIPFFVLNVIIEKALPQKRQLIISSVVSIVIASLIAAALMYLFKPNKTSTEIYPWDLEDSTQFSCSIKIGTTLFPRQNLKKDALETIDGALFTNDKTKMAIEIDGKVLKMLTATSVGVGINKPAEFTIIKEDENNVVAVYPESDNLFPGIDTFILHKKSGTAVWTKSSPGSLISKLPDAQAYYMECR